MKKSCCIILLLLCILTTRAQEVGIANDSMMRMQRYTYFFLEAVKQQEKKHYAAAFDLFCHARDISPTSAEVYYQLANYYIDLKDNTKVLEYLKRAATLSPKNDTYQERLAQFYITQTEYDKAIETYENLYRNHRDRDDVLQLLLRLYANTNNYEQMIHTLERMEILEGANEQITLTKIQIFEQQGEKTKALRELKQLVNNHPNDLNYRVMLGNWLLQNDNPKAALKEYKAVLREEPENQMAMVSMLDYYRSQGQNAKVDELCKSLLRNPHTEQYTKTAILRQTIQQNQQGECDNDKVLQYFDDALSTPQENGDIYLLKASYGYVIQMPQDSINAFYIKALDVEPDNIVARLYLIQELWRAEDYDNVIAYCRPARQYHPEEMRFYYFQGLAHFQKKEKDEALETFRMGVSQINNESEPDIVSDFYELMGDILHEKGLDEESFAAYDSCLHWKPNNIGCLNNYAYFLAIKGRDLAKAEKMSYQTIKAEPQNATFLDTYAWILHLQGREEEAKTYMEETLRYDPNPSEEVIQHAEEILKRRISPPSSLPEENMELPKTE